MGREELPTAPTTKLNFSCFNFIKLVFLLSENRFMVLRLTFDVSRQQKQNCGGFGKGMNVLPFAHVVPLLLHQTNKTTNVILLGK